MGEEAGGLLLADADFRADVGLGEVLAEAQFQDPAVARRKVGHQGAQYVDGLELLKVRIVVV